jgi:hypothetical protein
VRIDGQRVRVVKMLEDVTNPYLRGPGEYPGRQRPWTYL